MDGVELVLFGETFFFPVPLDDGRFQQGGRGICIEFIKFDVPAVKVKVEAAIDGQFIVQPGVVDVGPDGFGDSHLGIQVVRDDMLCRVARHGIEFPCGGFQPVCFFRGKLVITSFSPIVGVVEESQFLNLVRIMFAGGYCLSLHDILAYEADEWLLPVEPKAGLEDWEDVAALMPDDTEGGGVTVAPAALVKRPVLG